MAGQVFTSTHTPAIQIEIDPAFYYIGNIEFDLKGIAHADRHIFVDARQNQVRRMIVLQFEGFLDNNRMTYSYLPHNLILLGGEGYGKDNFFFSNIEEITANPGAETDYTLALLRSHGFQVEDEQMTARFARIIDSEGRNEFLIFYHENIRITGHTLAEIAKDEIILEQYQDIAEDLTQRSLQSFQIIEPLT